MGSFSVTSETAFSHSAEDIYDYVSNPHNWSRNYKGSAGIEAELEVPLKVGDTWSELVDVGEGNVYRSTWRLITAKRPRKWVFQQVDDIGQRLDGTGGVEGITTISYTFTSPGQGITLFTRTLHCELPKGVGIPDPLLLVRARPDGIDRYHAAIREQLDAARNDAAGR